MSAPRGESLTILPLGGYGEVGLNCTLLEQDGQAILLDCGALIGVDDAPGVDRVVPGFEPVFGRGRRLSAVILTHGHEDHIGALAPLLAEVDVPVFGTGVTCDLVRQRLDRDGRVAAAARAQIRRLVEVEAGSRFEVGPFAVELFHVTHSIPGSLAVGVECAGGRLLHTGDFRLDPEPWDGRLTDLAGIEAFAARGLDLLLSDSTNAERPGCGTSERAVAAELARWIETAAGRVVVTSMASHLHRLAGVAEAAQRAGRRVCLLGRSMERNWAIGVKRRILPSDPHLLVVPERLAALPRAEVVVLATGCQGEWSGGLARIAAGQDSTVRMLPGERVIFSARVIPGREVAVRRIVNRLAAQQVEVVGPDQAPVHASGHARQEEQRALIERCRPRWFVPAYGERAMLEAHARTAREAGLPEARVRVIEDGQALLLRDGSLELGDRETTTRRPVDAEGRVMDWGDVRARSRIGRRGLLTCSLALGPDGRVRAPPALTERGLGLDAGTLRRLVAAVEAAIGSAGRHGETLEDRVQRALRSAWDGRQVPEVVVQVVTVDARA